MRPQGARMRLQRLAAVLCEQMLLLCQELVAQGICQVICIEENSM